MAPAADIAITIQQLTLLLEGVMLESVRMRKRLSMLLERLFLVP
jgi:hypothetical protein